MHPLYITAAFTFLLAAGVAGPVLWHITPPKNRRVVLSMWVAAWAMSPAAYYLIRVPLLVNPLTPWMNRLTELGGFSRAIADAVRLSFAPLTEEPAKLLPWLALIALGFRLAPSKKMIVPIACALGVGFAMGEFWLVAQLIIETDNGEFRDLPWYQFGGYINERILTCFSHSLFALPTVLLARRGWPMAVVGLLIGMSLHFLGNAPIVLMRRNVFEWGPMVWGVIVYLWVLGFSVVGAIALAYIQLGKPMMRRVFRARMICPGCGAEYKQSLVMGLNFGRWRYEPCRVCKKWHWVSFENLAALPEQTAEITQHPAPSTVSD